MENKKTTELLDLLAKNTGDNYDSEKSEELLGELRNREPFFTLMNPDWDESLPKVFQLVAELQEEIKKLKRHKHDAKTDEVMVRI